MIIILPIINLEMFAIFKQYPQIIAAVSQKKDDSMKLSKESRERFLRKLGIKNNLIVRTGLVHRNRVEIVSKKEAGKIVEEVDGLITGDKNLFLTITVADCLPIFIFDPGKEVIGLIHGGWRNLVKNILAVAVEKITKNFGSSPEDILAGIGPSISQCHFEVKNDLLAEFEFLGLLQNSHDRENFVLVKEEGKLFLDLKKVAKLQLVELGIQQKNIEVSPECTFCLKDKYFSFRREGHPETPQTMLAVIGRR